MSLILSVHRVKVSGDYRLKKTPSMLVQEVVMLPKNSVSLRRLMT